MALPSKNDAAVAAAWKSLHEQWRQQKVVPLRELFVQDSERFSRFSVLLGGGDGGLLMDYSKTAITPAIVDGLLTLAGAAGVEAWRDAMFAGERINTSEDRAVLHTALRAAASDEVFLNGKNIVGDVLAAREKMLVYAEDCRIGNIASSTGEPYTDIINIGIGGSDLGPAMATAALAPDCARARMHFVSNMDGAHLADVVKNLNARSTLIIISSKTFTTAETLTNAHAARAWLLANRVDKSSLHHHLAAVSSAPQLAQEFGIASDRIFSYEDWVGGRYSVWGAVGLPLALAIGREKFCEFLAGGREMDVHFRSAPAAQNMPLLLGLLSVFHRNVCGYPTRAILPYDQRLHLLPAYLQQLDMESNGKRVTRDNESATIATSPVVWGSVGTNAQHAYFQMLHQGTDIVPCEFILSANARGAVDDSQHKQLLANGLAQSAALMGGEQDDNKPAHRHFVGNRPSITLFHHSLTPRALGRLIALFEHRAFVEGIVWGINSFDQWGVELGKVLARNLSAHLNEGKALPPETDASTNGLLAHYRTLVDQ